MNSRELKTVDIKGERKGDKSFGAMEPYH